MHTDFCTVLTCEVLTVKYLPHEQTSVGRFLPQQEGKANRVNLKETRPTLTTQRNKCWRSTPYPTNAMSRSRARRCSVVAIASPICVEASLTMFLLLGRILTVLSVWHHSPNLRSTPKLFLRILKSSSPPNLRDMTIPQGYKYRDKRSRL